MALERQRGAVERPAALQLRLAYADVREFVEKFGANITAQGIFVRSRDPRPVGSKVSFELRLKTGEVAFSGDGTVRFVQLPDAKGERVPGMGLEYGTLSEASRKLIGEVEAARAAGKVPAPVPPAVAETWRPLSEFVPPPEETFEVVEDPAEPPVLAPAQEPGALAAKAVLTVPAAAPSAGRMLTPTLPLTGSALTGPIPTAPIAESGAASAFDVPVERRGPAFDEPPVTTGDSALTGDLLAGALAASDGGVRLSPAPAPDAPEREERTDPMFAPGGAKTAGANLVFAEPADDPSRLARAPASAPPVVAPGATPAKGVPVVPARAAEPALVGIDYGWAVVRVATASGGRLRTLSLGKGGDLSSGIVEQRGQVLLDEDVAGKQYRGLSRLLGQWPGSFAAGEFERRQFAQIAPAEDGRAGIVIGGQAHAASALVSRVLGAVRERTSVALGGAPLQAALVVPASFSAASRRALREAAEQAGITVERLVATPLAVLAASPVKGARRVLVVEFTEGRFEASIVECPAGSLQLVGTAAATELGTIELDLALTGAMLEQFEKETGLLVPEDAVLFERVRAAAARAKEALGDSLDVEVHVPELVPMGIAKAELRQRLTRAKFLSVATPLFDRALEVVREVLAQRNLGPKEVDAAVVWGSGARLPAFLRKLAERLGKEPVALTASDLAAQGAVLAADEKVGTRPQLMAGVGATTVVALPGGGVRRLFERGAKVPAERTYSAMVAEGAHEHELFLFQGDRTPVYTNELVGAAKAGPLAGGKGTQQVTYVVATSEDGEITVRARDTAGREVPVTFDRHRPPESVRRALEGK